MIKIIHLSGNLDCCGQVFEQDLESLKGLGYDALICARPDGESTYGLERQPKSLDLQVIWESLGLHYEHIPFRNLRLDLELSREFCRRCDHLRSDYKVLAFCRSGGRIVEAWLHSDWQSQG